MSIKHLKRYLGQERAHERYQYFSHFASTVVTRPLVLLRRWDDELKIRWEFSNPLGLGVLNRCRSDIPWILPLQDATSDANNEVRALLKYANAVRKIQ